MRLLVIILLFPFWLCSAQAQYHDFGTRTGLSADKKLTKYLSLSANMQMRLEENYSKIGSGLLDFQIGYKLNKKVSFGFSYRFSQKNDFRTSWETRHRAQLRLVLKKKIKPVTLQYRTIYQVGFSGLYKPENYYSPNTYWRNKVQFKLDIDKKIEPYLASEVFYNVSNNVGVDGYRIALGLNWDLPNKMEMKTGYLFQQELYQVNPVTEHIFVVEYSFSL